MQTVVGRGRETEVRIEGGQERLVVVGQRCCCRSEMTRTAIVNWGNGRALQRHVLAGGA